MDPGIKTRHGIRSQRQSQDIMILQEFRLESSGGSKKWKSIKGNQGSSQELRLSTSVFAWAG